MEVCCICFDTPSPDEPIYRIGCGCKIAWFHLSCETKWLSNNEYPYSCPTCRRYVPLRNNYSFSFFAGPDQKFLWFSLTIFSFEVVFALCKRMPIIPLQGLAILATPHILYSNRYQSHFLIQTLIHVYMNCVIFYYWEPVHSYELSKMIGTIQVFLLYSLHYIKYRLGFYVYVHPLIPYVISREVIHIETLVAKTPADTLERTPRSGG